MSNNKNNLLVKNKVSYGQDGYRPTSGRSVNTANPPKGGSGVPPKSSAQAPANKK